MGLTSQLRCPSAQPGMRDLKVLGVVERTEEGPRVASLREDVAASAPLLEEAKPLRPTEVFRMTAVCEHQRCVHFSGNRCELAGRVVSILPAVVDALPVCMIRAECRWFAQEGRAACLRCPQVVTESTDASEDFVRAARPSRHTPIPLVAIDDADDSRP